MILAPGTPGPPASRLLSVLESRGHRIDRGSASAEELDDSLVILAPGTGAVPLPAGKGKDVGILVLSAIGAHPDARAEPLRDLWRLEEDARATGLSVLTLRLGPLLGPTSPLWLKLRSPGRLPDRGRILLNPVPECDVVATLERAIAERSGGQVWYEVIGPEIWSLADLADLAKQQRGAPRAGAAWEPGLDVLGEQRLGEAGLWLDRFGIVTRPLADRAQEWAA